MKSSFLKWAAVLFALFHVYNNLFTAVSELWFSAIHFGGFGALCALAFHHTEKQARSGMLRTGFNALLAVLSLAVAVYLILFETALYEREANFILSDYLFASAAILLALEFTRRTSGWFMPFLIVVSLSYILFLGRYIPGVFAFLIAKTITCNYSSHVVQCQHNHLVQMDKLPLLVIAERFLSKVTEIITKTSKKSIAGPHQQ